MNTRQLIITTSELKDRYDLPTDIKIVSGGPTTGTERGEFGGIFAEVSSKEFKIEDCGKPIELKES